MEDILGEENLRLFPTKIYYEKLDKGYSDCEYSDFYNPAKIELSGNKGLQNVSEQILNALCYVYRNSSREISDNRICNFLYYWLGNILLENLDNKMFFSEVILKLIDTLKYYSNENICNLVYTNIDEDVFKKIKLIFDFTEDYENYELDLAKPNRLCNEKYNSYLTTYVETYKELYNKCILEHQTDKYCQAFKKYYNDEKRINLYTWSCTLKKSTKAPPLVVESGKSAHVEQLGGISDRGSQSELSQPTIKAENQQDAEQPVQDHNFNGGISETIITEHPSDDKSTSITSKSITGALSVAGILVPSYLMYNYTPAGIWISKLLGRNKGPNFNSYANQELMPNFSMPGDLYSERNRYNIMYNPE